MPNRSRAEMELERQLKSYGFPKFQTNVSPVLSRKWTVDFFWTGGEETRFRGVVVEVHASQLTFKDTTRNYEKSNWLSMAGYIVLHFDEAQINSGEALKVIWDALDIVKLIAWDFSKFDTKLQLPVIAPKNRKLRRFYREWILEEDHNGQDG